MNIIQILFASFLILSYFKIIIRQDTIQNELTTSELHNKTLIEIVDGVRTLKHDYGNIVQALNGYVVTKQYDKLGEYVNSLIKEFSSVNNVSAIDPKIFNEPAIYGVVGAKYFYATDNDITFEIEVTSDIKSISFSKPELSRIFGILLDNAIEATQKIENKYIKLEISFNDNKYADVIRIINTYDTSIDIDLEKIYEKGVSSKEVKSGIGLWEVAKLVNRNKHSQIYATIEKDKFVQNLIIERID
ncbi:MAG: GHKL domain-containing protein [Clostridia bacterium]|nr:GHKL domain-containing protein [Clostridia bacterium]